MERGIIYIGIDDTGNVVGVKDSKKLMEDIPNKIQKYLGIIADINLRREDEIEYIEFIASPVTYPRSYKGEYHYRSGSMKQQFVGVALTDFSAKNRMEMGFYSLCLFIKSDRRVIRFRLRFVIWKKNDCIF